MLSIVDNPCSYNVYFDNLFTDHALLVHLRNFEFNATKIIRENRLSNCQLKESKVTKKEPRGKYDMAEVDKHDWFAGKYSISIIGKKWYWNQFIRLLDMTMINVRIVHIGWFMEPIT